MILRRSRAPAVRNVVVASGKKTDLKKQGLESIKNAVVKQNLMGVSKSMDKKGWTDPSGRKGKVQLEANAVSLARLPRLVFMYRFISEKVATSVRGCLMLGLYCARWHVMRVEGLHPPLQGFGVYRFANKYGANVDGYSPIYTPDAWAETGSQYSLGVKGLIAW